MPRALSTLQSNFPYSIGARCINKEWFGAPLEEVWEIMSEELFFAYHAFDLKIHAFVLMQNHFHLLASTPRANLSEIMLRFMTQTSLRITKNAGRINNTYGKRHFRTVLGSYQYYVNSYKYVYYNPVKAGLCGRVEEYRFSSLHRLLGQERLCFPVEEDTLFFADPGQTIRWLNRPPKEQHWLCMKRALKRRVFKLPLDRKSKEKNDLETNAL